MPDAASEGGAPGAASTDAIKVGGVPSVWPCLICRVSPVRAVQYTFPPAMATAVGSDSPSATRFSQKPCEQMPWQITPQPPQLAGSSERDVSQPSSRRPLQSAKLYTQRNPQEPDPVQIGEL